MTHSCLLEATLEARNRPTMHLRLTAHEEGRVSSCICIASVRGATLGGAVGTTGCNDLTAGAHDGKNFPLFGSPGHISQHSFVLYVHTHVGEAESWAVFAVTHDCGLYAPASTVLLATLWLGGGLWSVDDSVVLEGDDRVFFLPPPLSLISSYLVMEWDTGEGVSSLIYPAAMYTRLHHHRLSCDNSANAPMGRCDVVIILAQRDSPVSNSKWLPTSAGTGVKPVPVWSIRWNLSVLDTRRRRRTRRRREDRWYATESTL